MEKRIERQRPGRRHRGAAAIVMVVLLLVLNLIVMGMVMTGGGDSAISVLNVDGVRAMYATEAGMNMALRELIVNLDEDTDGTVGSISDDANDANDPVVGTAAVVVSRTDGVTNATIRSRGRARDAARAIETELPLDRCGIPFETGTVVAGGTPVTIDLKKRYVNPVVVCTPHINNNTVPIVPRVDNVDADSFDLRLQEPGDGTTPASELISYMVMESGSWTVNGVAFEAQRYSSSTTDQDNSWVGTVQSYLQTYTSPVVLGQVMTENDSLWSAFWCRGSSRSAPPSNTTIWTGKHVAEDSNVARAIETVGFIVFETGNGTIGTVAMDARLSADNVLGMSDSPPYNAPFNTSFTTTPDIILATMAAMDGGNGGWALVHGEPGATTALAQVVVEEDQINDSERNHTSEQVGVVAFEEATLTPPVLVWREVAP
ncbi:MAG: hypothetical protein GY715_14910 [Planctomycetes bacterium]|nr:hypothetical protein [Planctomycetota bacterium]